MRVALYARYSAGPRQTDQSIEGQVRVCTDYCKQKNFTIVEVYADKHISGKTDDRPEFQRLIADSKKNKFEGVVVYKTDRFARNKYDSAIYKRQLRNNGIQIYYAAESIPDGPEGIILESLMEGLAEYYSAELAQKIKRGMHESALKCRILGNSIPLGYRASKDRTYEIDPDSAKAVELIFDMYIKQHTNADICRKLNDLGYRTSSGQPFNKNSINRIIQNEKYIGIYKAADVVVEDGVPAIISKDTFYLAQKERKRRTVSKKTRKTTAEYMLSGKLFCGYCKKPMSGVSGTGKNGNKFYYYYCPTVRAKGNCHKEHVARDIIEDLIAKKTAEYILQPEILDDITEKVWQLQAETDTKDEDIAHYKKKLAENKRASTNILKAIETGIASETLLERLQTLESEKTAIEGELAYLKTATFGLSKSQIHHFLHQFLTPDEDWMDYKRRIIKSFVHKVYLYDDHFTVIYTIGANCPNTQEIKLDNCSSEVFDEQLQKWSWRDVSRTPEATVIVGCCYIILTCKLQI
jgi:DNA invertase Pin-like site-specific DNA recombinase